MKKIHLKYFYSSDAVFKHWQTLYSSKHSAFISPSWHLVVDELYQYARLDKILKSKRYFYAVHENQTVVGFFYIARTTKKKTLHFSHEYGASDYYGWSYSPDMHADTVNKIIHKIAADHQAAEIRFGHLKSGSLLQQALFLEKNVDYTNLKCVSVNLGDDYLNYLKTLTKSVRQNLRTANNRKEKNNIKQKYNVLSNVDASNIDFQRLKQMYFKRNRHKGNNVGWKSRLLKFLNYGFGHKPDMFDTKAIKDTDFTLAELFLDDKLAAYFFGFRSESRIEINRVVINDEFKFYSPGLLLLTRYIETEIPNGLRELDLTVGDEKYKYDLGGKEHLIYNVKIKV